MRFVNGYLSQPKKNLTCREREVLILKAKGFTEAQIAEKLFVSKETIVSHRNNILVKLEANNTAHAVYLAIVKGLIK